MFKSKLAASFAEEGLGPSVSHLAGGARVAFLQRTYALTFVALLVAGITGFVSARVIAGVPALQSDLARIVIILGSILFAQYGCQGLVRNKGTAMLGLILANASMGVALGYLLLTAMLFGHVVAGSPFLFIGQALGLTVAACLGITGYVWFNPSEFRWAHATVSALFLPMILFMVFGFFFDFGGPIGIVISGVFVLVSALGLLLSTRDVLHVLREDQQVEGAYLISIGVIILFWNILVLLMRITGNSRD